MIKNYEISIKIVTGSHIYHAKNHNDVIPVFIEVTNTAVSCEGVPLSAM